MRDDWAFVRTFAAEALDLLPEPPWTQLVVLRSAPGAGKTSLMRLLTASSLYALHARARTNDPLAQRLREFDVLDDSGPRFVGVLLNLERDYRSLLDLGLSDPASERLFFRLVDARVMHATVRAVLIARGREFPAHAAEVEFVPSPQDAGAARALEKLGGTSGSSILEEARATEDSILTMLDSLEGSPTETVPGHLELLSLRALNGVTIKLGGHATRLRPLVMFDDAHRLAPQQRASLLDRLRDRSLDVPRLYAERLSALSADDLVGGTPGRDHRTVHIEDLFRGVSRSSDSAGKMTPARFSAMLLNLAARRADPILTRYLGQVTFADFIDVDEDDLLEGREKELADVLHSRIVDAAQGSRRYLSWIAEAEAHVGRTRIARLAELEVLITRDRARTQGELFEVSLSPEDASARSSAAVRDAALLRLALNERLPYYSGLDTVTKLASANVEQFLSVCGDLFADVLADLAVGRHPALEARRQDRLVRRASDRFYNDIRVRVPNGDLVQQFVDTVALLAQREADKPTIPYPPGVTGTALTMRDRDRLMDPARRDSLPGAPELYHALANAVAHNIVWVDLDYSVKGDRYMVIYLNRLLCPRFGLHLGKGGFREKPLSEMASWMISSTAGPRTMGYEPGVPLL